MGVVRLLLMSAMLLGGTGALGQASEQQIKAAFLFRFLSFVEWPAQALGSPGAPLVIGVIEADELHAELEKIVSGRTVNDRPVAVERVKAGDKPARAHVLFVGRQASSRLRGLASISTVLLVAESEGALEQGALINFLVRDDRVRFEVAPDEAERRGLRIGARLLAVALNLRQGATRP